MPASNAPYHHAYVAQRPPPATAGKSHWPYQGCMDDSDHKNAVMVRQISPGRGRQTKRITPEHAMTANAANTQTWMSRGHEAVPKYGNDCSHGKAGPDPMPNVKIGMFASQSTDIENALPNIAALPAVADGNARPHSHGTAHAMNKLAIHAAPCLYAILRKRNGSPSIAGSFIAIDAPARSAAANGKLSAIANAHNAGASMSMSLCAPTTDS